jgi:hypothetical protein
MKFRLISLHATPVVPLPAKGSKTKSFSCVVCNKCLLTNSNGLIVGCSKRSLSFRKQTITQPFKFKNENLEKLRLTYKQKDAKDIYLAIIELYNSGNQAITKYDYAEPITVSFGENAQIFGSEIVDNEPTGSQLSLSPDSKLISLSPSLLKPKESLKIKALVNNLEGVHINCRIAGIGEITEIISQRPQFLTKSTLLLGTMLFSLLAVIIFQSMPSYILIWNIFIMLFLISLVLSLGSSFLSITHFIYNKFFSKHKSPQK